MWFHDEDHISAHTLAFAAYEVAHFVSKAKHPTRDDLLLDSSQVKPHQRKQFNQVCRKAANFFKHADRDPDETIEFSSGLTQVFIYYAIRGIDICGVKLAPELDTFMYWMQVRNPVLMSEQAFKVFSDSGFIKNFAVLQAMHKSQFFEAMMDCLTKRAAA
jgi:hypothetical protein